jgi:hypothetical protein
MQSNFDKDHFPSEGSTDRSHPIIYIDKSEIREGKYEEIKRSVKNLVEFVKENVPQLIYYSFFFNEKHTQMTVISVHPNSESLEYHMAVGKEEFRKFSDLLDLLKIEVYGNITDSVHELLRQKAQMLGKGTVDVHDFNAGFFR